MKLRKKDCINDLMLTDFKLMCAQNGVSRSHILVMAPADNTLVFRPVLEPLGHIRLDAKILALSERQTRVKLQH